MLCAQTRPESHCGHQSESKQARRVASEARPLETEEVGRAIRADGGRDAGARVGVEPAGGGASRAHVAAFQTPPFWPYPRPMVCTTELRCNGVKIRKYPR